MPLRGWIPIAGALVLLAFFPGAASTGEGTGLRAGAPGLEAQTRPAATPQTAPEGFVPVNELPPHEQLPAAPLLIAAYAFVWVMIVLYLWSLWRRIGAVEKEMAAVSRRVEDARSR